MRYLVRAFWILLALVFLVEAWLWDHLQPVVAWVVERLPLRKLKAKIAAWIKHLPPTATLVVFLVPVVALLPFKLFAVVLMARGEFLSATGILILAKLLGVGITAFMFDAARERLLLIAWFRWLYWHVMAWRDWAHAMIDPIRRRVRRYVRMFAPRRASRAVRLLLRIRRRAHAVQTTA
jgi:hypothetical protein